MNRPLNPKRDCAKGTFYSVGGLVRSPLLILDTDKGTPVMIHTIQFRFFFFVSLRLKTEC